MRKFCRDLNERLGLRIGKKKGNQLRGSTPCQVLKTGWLDQEWEVGLEWYLKRIKGEKIVDTGFVSHQNFSKLLAKLGFTVYSVDLGQFTGYFPNLNYLNCLVWDIPVLKDETIDTIIANSLLEHLGLECYGQPSTPKAETITMNEFDRILKLDGKLLMQVPYAKETTIIYHNKEQFYKTYTDKSLRQVIEPRFKIVEKTFYARGERCWIEVNQEVADRIEQGSGFPVCLCYLEAVKN